MIAHELKIGQRIYDTHDNRWGEILLIGGKEEDTELTPEDSDLVVLYKPEDSDGECETMAENAYPIVDKFFFWGEDVCLEINKDKFDADHDYDYYCPERDENCWGFECM